MAAGKEKPEEKGLDPLGIERTLRDDAEEQLARFPKHSADLKGQTPEQLIHELEVHQIELETQAEDLRKSKLAIEESRDKFLDLYDFSPIGYLSLNDKALITEVNLSGAILLGVERKDLVGAPFSKFMPEKYADQWYLYFMNVLKQDGKRSCTLMLNRSDDTTFPARLESLRLSGSDGAITVRIAFSDITDIWQIEALRASESFNRGLVENLPDYIVVYGMDGKILYANPATVKAMGYSAEDLVGTSVLSYVASECRDAVTANMAARLAGGVPATYETDVVRNDGIQRSVIVKGTPIQYHNSPAILLLLIDITERKRGEEALLRVNQKLNILSQLTRKNLSSQVFVLNSYLELAKKQVAGQDQVIATLEKGVQAIRSIHETIEYSKDYQDMGAKPPTWQNVKMALLFGLSHISIGKIQHSLETEDLEIFADPLLEMVCQRLFENSVKHGNRVTRIRVWHTFTPGGATIIFEDDGIGIPLEQKEQIFLRGEGTGRASMRSLIFVGEILSITGITITETGEPGKGARFEMVVPEGMYR
jgi:PAS domain S-box-containing protein